tara:strand:- start:3757 stop:4515 length:759 start_codon:yes stop_codon:yes gene_type:complete
MPNPVIEIVDPDGSGISQPNLLDPGDDLIIDILNPDGSPINITEPSNQNLDTQTLTFTVGWNIVSLYLDVTCGEGDFVPNAAADNASGYSAQLFLDKLGDNMIIMKTYLGTAFLPEFDFNGIGNLTNGWGYQIKVNEPQTITFTGKKIIYDQNPSSTQISVVEGLVLDFPTGWFICGMVVDTPKDMAEVFEPFISAGIFIIGKNYLGEAFLPEWGFNGIGNMLPGQGYQVKLTQGGTLDFTVDVAATTFGAG